MITDLIAAIEQIDVRLLERAKRLLHDSPRIFFVGNGGSSAIASHMAIDYAKNGGVPAMAFNDPAALTCLANDYGYEHVFSRQIEYHCKLADTVVLISSSGRSQNILNAARSAAEIGCNLVTLSGFDVENPLRQMGRINFWVDSHDYGVVEITHLAILHSMVVK